MSSVSLFKINKVIGKPGFQVVSQIPERKFIFPLTLVGVEHLPVKAKEVDRKNRYE